jgi:serine/threonine-protein kinase
LRADAARVVENVAASIADGARVDWNQADAQVSGRERRLVRHLRLIDSLAEVYRTLPSRADEPGLPPSTRPEYPEGPRWGRLILLDRIGRGTSADVFRAWDAELQREVALKLLHDDGVSSSGPANAHLLEEARRLARIRHPHVVHVYGAERHEDRIGLWMELVRGRSLDEVVQQEGTLGVAEAAHIGIELCSALATVHAAGLLHRDIKAQNVVREDSGRIVLMDFGTGEEIDDKTRRLAGTPIYLAPEVIEHGPASVQSDLYAVGVLLFHAMTGQFPVVGDSLEGLAEAHREGRIRGLREVRPEIPPSIARVVDRALAPDPRRRYASASAMEAALRQGLDGLPGERRRAHGQWWVIGTMMAAIVALVGALVAQRTPTRAAASDVTSIAVLPLKYVSGAAEDSSYLADALTDELITRLGQIHSLRVTGLTSVSRFRNTDASRTDVARQLGVDALLEGTVAVQPSSGQNPGRVHVNARLLKAGSEVELWSGSLERPLGDVVSLEAELARVITRQIDVRLAGTDATRIQRARRTQPAAEQAYLEGRAHLGQLAARASLALAAFNRALAIDPDHPGAHAGAARSYIALGFDGAISQPEARAGAAREVERALELEPDLSEAHAVAADLRFYYDWNFEAAEREYQRALDLDPSASFARSQYAQFLAALGRLDDAEAQAAEATAVDPLSAPTELNRALILYYHRKFDDAFGAARHAETLDPTLPTTQVFQGRILEARGELEAAIQKTQRAIDSSATVAVGFRVQLLRLQALSGQVDRAREGFVLLQQSKDGAYLASTPHEAYVRVATGEPDIAFAVLGRALDLRDPSVLWLGVDPRLDPLRRDPRFGALRKRLGLP